MKVLNKFLWMCFTCVVNVFCCSGNVFASIVVELKQTCNGGTGQGTCKTLKDGNCTNNGIMCYDEVNDAKTAWDNFWKTSDCSNYKDGCNIVKCKNTQYVSGCVIEGVSTNDVDLCISSETGDFINSITCLDCPEEGIVAGASSLDYKSMHLWVCGRGTVYVESGADNISTNATGVTTPSCREYVIKKYVFKNRKNTEKSCYKSAGTVYNDEKGTFTYTEDCYIDTE